MIRSHKKTGVSPERAGLPGLTKEEREALATESEQGIRPPERAGYTLYARLNHNRYGDSYIWVYSPIVLKRRRLK